jgi:hypothetical protein
MIRLRGISTGPVQSGGARRARQTDRANSLMSNGNGLGGGPAETRSVNRSAVRLDGVRRADGTFAAVLLITPFIRWPWADQSADQPRPLGPGGGPGSPQLAWGPDWLLTKARAAFESFGGKCAAGAGTKPGGAPFPDAVARCCPWPKPCADPSLQVIHGWSRCRWKCG